MKREVHAECHHEKESEGSRKGEIYACRHAKFRQLHYLLIIFVCNYLESVAVRSKPRVELGSSV